MNVTSKASAQAIIEYLSVPELRLIFLQSLPKIRQTEYNFRCSRERNQIFRREMKKTYKEKIEQLEELALMI
jgi:hypothetical protein